MLKDYRCQKGSVGVALMLFVGVPVAALMNIFFSVVLAALLDKVGPVKPYLAKSAGTSPAGRYGIMRSSASLESISARNPDVDACRGRPRRRAQTYRTSACPVRPESAQGNLLRSKPLPRRFLWLLCLGQVQLVAEAGRGAEFSKYGCEISGSVRVSERSKSQRLDHPTQVALNRYAQRSRFGE